MHDYEENGLMAGHPADVDLQPASLHKAKDCSPCERMEIQEGLGKSQGTMYLHTRLSLSYPACWSWEQSGLLKTCSHALFQGTTEK